MGRVNSYLMEEKDRDSSFVVKGKGILSTPGSALTSPFVQTTHDLIEKNQWLETIIDSTLSMITVVDRNFRYLIFNTTAQEYTGSRKENVLGQNMFDVFPHLKTTAVEENLRRALMGEIVTEGPSDSILQHGRIFETLYLPLRNLAGEIESVMIKVHDRTEAVQTERKLKAINERLQDQNRELHRQAQFIETLFDATVDAIAVFDTSFRYISMNKKGLEMYGFEKEQIIGKRLIEVFPELEHSTMYRDLRKAMDGEFVYDLSYTSSVLKKVQFQNYYVPLKDGEGGVYAVMVIGHDISELVRITDKLKATNQELEIKNTELQRSNEELEQFAYIASHDLQEPIRKIATYSNKLLTRNKDTMSEEVATYLGRINKATGRMYELINGLLMYSRITRHNNLFVPTQLDVILKEVLTDFELKIQEKKVAIQFSKLPEIEAMHVQMVQMFSNLIANSFKFSKTDVPPVIQIACSDVTEEQKTFYKLNPRTRYLNIFYLDNGIGFDQKFSEKIFELFQRLHDRHEYDGSGLGLSICKKIVSNHHGLIFAFSEPGKGATFQIILPYTQKYFTA